MSSLAALDFYRIDETFRRGLPGGRWPTYERTYEGETIADRLSMTVPKYLIASLRGCVRFDIKIVQTPDCDVQTRLYRAAGKFCATGVYFSGGEIVVTVWYRRLSNRLSQPSVRFILPLKTALFTVYGPAMIIAH